MAQRALAVVGLDAADVAGGHGSCRHLAWLNAALVTPWPVAKLMPSWQAPQARRLGTFLQLSPCGCNLGRGAVVALGAIPDVLRELGFVQQDAAIVIALLDQQLALVDPVDQDREVADRHAVGNVGAALPGRRCSWTRLRSAVLALIGVADHAELRVVATAAVEGRAFGTGDCRRACRGIRCSSPCRRSGAVPGPWRHRLPVAGMKSKMALIGFAIGTPGVTWTPLAVLVPVPGALPEIDIARRCTAFGS